MSTEDDSAKTQKDWKDGFLSTGVPLEHDVKRILGNAGFTTSPLEYRRPTMERAGSIDLHATAWWELERAIIEIFAECKYSRPGALWMFTPSEEWADSVGWQPFRPSLAVASAMGTREWPLEAVWAFPGKWPGVSSRAVQVHNGNAARDKILHGVHQVQYALAERLPVLTHRYFFTYGQDRIAIAMPLIVTTAELWVLKPKTSTRDVEHAKNIEDVADCYPNVVMTARHDDELTSVLHDGFAATFDAASRDALGSMLREYITPLSLIELQCRSAAEFVAISTLEGLPQFLAQFLKIIPSHAVT